LERDGWAGGSLSNRGGLKKKTLAEQKRQIFRKKNMQGLAPAVPNGTGEPFLQRWKKAWARQNKKAK